MLESIHSPRDLDGMSYDQLEEHKKKLAELKIPIRAEDTGLNYGRTVEFFPESGDFVIKAVGKPVKTI